MVEERKNIGGRRKRGNQLIAVACFGVFFVMVGLVYCAVPLYRSFNSVPTIAGGRMAAADAPHVLDRKLDVVFDANTRNGLRWDFHPLERSITMKIGETREARYLAHNDSRQTTQARATFNVAPDWAAAYVRIIRHFCCGDIALQPGETRDMPVVFFVDPALAKAEEAKGLHSITLSYTMFPVDATATSSIARHAVAETVPGVTTTSSAKNIGG